VAHRLRSVLLFGQVIGALLLRSGSSGALTHRMRCGCRLRKRWLACGKFVRTRYGRFGNIRRRVRGARSGGRASVFGKCAKVSFSRGSFPPNKSFKPTPHRGVNSVLCATLHAVDAPLRGGLTLALGGRYVRFPPPLCLSVQPSRSFPRLCRFQLLRSLRSAIMHCFGTFAGRAETSQALRSPVSETLIGFQ
jgi:hypothetical protein